MPGIIRSLQVGEEVEREESDSLYYYEFLLFLRLLHTHSDLNKSNVVARVGGAAMVNYDPSQTVPHRLRDLGVRVRTGNQKLRGELHGLRYFCPEIAE
jgi:hypothetical protein